MSVEFVVGAVRPDQFPRDGSREVAFVGRSNVGKSSLLNALLQRGKRRSGRAVDKKQLARVSATPGRTQSINFYRVEKDLYFVDLPGYGYAKAPKRAIEQWRRLADSYLTDREPLTLVVLIVDSRHGPTALDRQMAEWLEGNRKRFLVVASKVDKLKSSQREGALRSIQADFHPPLPFSTVTGEGVAALWDGVRASLEPKP